MQFLRGVKFLMRLNIIYVDTVQNGEATCITNSEGKKRITVFLCPPFHSCVSHSHKAFMSVILAVLLFFFLLSFLMGPFLQRPTFSEKWFLDCSRMFHTKFHNNYLACWHSSWTALQEPPSLRPSQCCCCCLVFYFIFILFLRHGRKNLGKGGGGWEDVQKSIPLNLARSSAASVCHWLLAPALSSAVFLEDTLFTWRGILILLLFLPFPTKIALSKRQHKKQ